MRYHPPEGPDLKLYRIGEEIFCVERPFPARTLREKRGRLLPVTAELEAIVRRCGDAFGIDVYGVDVVRHQGRLWVVDMSAFPGFKGVPEAGRRIADVVVDRLRDDAAAGVARPGDGGDAVTDIRFLLVRRVPDRPSPLLREVVSRLRRRGHTVSGAIVEDVPAAGRPPARSTTT